MSIRVILVDDHPVVRDGLRYRIEGAGEGIQVVGEASNGVEALERVARTPADVLVMDVTMPVMNGIEATRELVRRDPRVRVIVLSLHDHDSIVQEALAAGARGFLTKETATRHVVDAIRAVHAGRFFLGPEVAHVVVASSLAAGRGGRREAGVEALTPQERRVLQLIGEGLSGKEIAALLGVTQNTVHTHRSHVMAKLGIHRQAGLVRFATKEGLAKA